MSDFSTVNISPLGVIISDYIKTQNQKHQIYQFIVTVHVFNGFFFFKQYLNTQNIIVT